MLLCADSVFMKDATAHKVSAGNLHRAWQREVKQPPATEANQLRLLHNGMPQERILVVSATKNMLNKFETCDAHFAWPRRLS